MQVNTSWYITLSNASLLHAGVGCIGRMMAAAAVVQANKSASQYRNVCHVFIAYCSSFTVENAYLVSILNGYAECCHQLIEHSTEWKCSY